MNSIFLAAPSGPGNAEAGIQTFWDTSVGQTLGIIMGIAGVVVAIAAIFRGTQLVYAQKAPAAVKLALGAALLASVLIYPEIINSIISLMGDLVKSVIDSGSDVVDKGSQSAQ